MHMSAADRGSSPPRSLTVYAWLSIATAISTIALKVVAWQWTNSVGLLADAAESGVNLAAAVVTLIALRVAARPPDKDHQFGRTKAEYFSAAIEGLLIFAAAIFIIFNAVQRWIEPEGVQELGLGVIISLIAGLINGVVAWVLITAGRRLDSAALVADGKHLMADLLTSVGVVAGILAVAWTGIPQLDAVAALLVALHILWTGWELLRESSRALLDRAWPPEDLERLVEILEDFQRDDLQIHALRSRVSGRRRYLEMQVLVPGSWTVQQGHRRVESIESAIVDDFPQADVMCHLEPLEDPRLHDDYRFHVSVPASWSS